MKKQVKLLVTTLSIGVMLVISACGSSSGGTNSASSAPAGSPGKEQSAKPTAGGDTGGTMKIAMMADLSGKTALSGKFKKLGADLAVEDINANGGIMGKKLELIVEDNQGTQQGVVAAFQKLTSNKDIVAVIGPIRSTNAKAMNTYVAKAGIPTAIGGTNVDLTVGLKNPWFFRFRPHDGYFTKSIAEFTVNKLGKKKVAIIHDTDAFGTGSKDLMIENYKKMGIDVLVVEGVNTGTKDFAPFLKKVADSGADVLNTALSTSEDSGQLVKQIREKGYKFDIVGQANLTQETTIKVAGDALNGVYGVNDFALDQSPETIAFVDKFRAKYNETPDIYTAWVYDALHVFKNVIEEKKSTKPDDIKAGLLAIKDYKGVEGTYAFDQNGDGLHKYSIVKVENKKIVTVKD
jgi:branched-chain amino acid transport system substrate-binding protein